MNSNYKKPTNSTFNFDLNLGSSSQNRSLNDQKTNKTPSYNNNTYQNKSDINTTPSWQPKPSYTHQPPTRPGLPTGSPSMVGDIFGKTWGTGSDNSGIGLVNKNPNLFGDLVGSALGQGSRNTQNVPLKSATPVKTGNSGGYSGNSGNSVGGNVKSTNLGGYSGNSGNGIGNNVKSPNFGGYNANSGINVGNSMKSTNLGGQSMGSGLGRDPFASLGGFGSKPAGIGNSGNKPSSQKDEFFGGFQDGAKAKSPEVKNDFFGSGSSFDDFVKPKTENPPPGSDNVFDSFFPSSSSSAPVKGNDGFGSDGQFSGGDDWGIDSDNNGGGTMELEGLPPPPAGISASGAKSKGMDNYKQGQYADAIKWLSWAVILLEKSGDDVARMEVLSSRASCYKEVGEYKKAVADCTKVLEHDEKSVSALVQRAMLYESMEKYKLGADDLRTVMKLDPMNRVARSTIHRLNKMAG